VVGFKPLNSESRVNFSTNCAAAAGQVLTNVIVKSAFYKLNPTLNINQRAAEAQLVEKSTRDSKFKGSNPATAISGIKRWVKGCFCVCLF